MHPRFKFISEKKMIGLCAEMSLTDDKTRHLFSSFMPRKKEILNSKSDKVYDLKIYPKNYFENFHPSTSFTKWAIIEVTDFNNIPDGMKSFNLPPGDYAIFPHKGSAFDNSPFEYIYGTWLAQSNYHLDSRPHFDIMPNKKAQNLSNLAQEIWIPIRR